VDAHVRLATRPDTLREDDVTPNALGPTGREGRHIRILIADEQSLFREAVRSVLEDEPDMTVVAEARDGLQAVAETERCHPDVVVLDASLPNCDGIRATGLIKDRAPASRILILCGEEDGRVLVDALEAGANGFLSKGSPISELIQVARTLARGETFIPPQMMDGLLSRLIRRKHELDEAHRHLSRLTRREQEVLRLLAEGADNHRIAQALVISPQTARTHVQNVLGKLGVHSRLEAAAFATRSGLWEGLLAPEGLDALG
jgi:DNA-binding NarL/FixJ family response regulator